MTRSLTFLLLLIACDPVASTQSTNPGTQIGGIDCEYDKLFLDVQDAAGSPTSAEVQVTFPSGDVATESCSESGCQVELDGPGSYALAVDAGETGSSNSSFVLDDSTVAGQLTADCGDRPFHEIRQTVTVRPEDDGGGGDILTSNIGLRVTDSSGNPVASRVIVTGPVEPPYPRDCGRGRCWIDIDGLGTYRLDATAGAERGTASITIDASHKLPHTNELGDDVYEAELSLQLK